MPRMTTLICPGCNEPFERKTSKVEYDLRRGRKTQYCSQNCASKANEKQRIELMCDFCGDGFKRTEAEMRQSESGHHFCSKSCAASFNNSPSKSGLPPKRTPIGDQICRICGETYQRSYRTKTCPECSDQKLQYGLSIITRRAGGYQANESIYSPLPIDATVDDIKPYGFYTIKELMGPPGPNRYRTVRDHARRMSRDQEQICVVTGYTKHVEGAHIRSVPDFSPDTPLKVVNDPRNLVLLSPNAHWELDHGELNIDELPDAKAFREFEKEAIEAGYLPPQS